MATNNTTIRYSKMSPPETTVNGNDIILVGQPDPTNLKTGYGVYKTTTQKLSDHFKTILKEEGLKDLITLGDGILGDGSPGSLELDENYLNNLGIRHDHLDLSYVGDRTFPVLPLSGSYFSINYPYDTEEEASTAYIESGGDMLILSPVTNGIEKRYTYTTIKNWVGGGRKVEPSDTVYQPPGLNPDEYVSAVFPATATAMLVEITNTTTGNRSHAVVLLNGTMGYQYHTLYRITDLVTWLWGEGTAYTWRTVQDRPPAVYVRNGKINIVGISGGAVQGGISLKWGVFDRSSGNITTITSVRTTGRMYSETVNTGVLRITGGFMTDQSGAAAKTFELSANTMFSTSSATNGPGLGAHKAVGISILQGKTGDRLAFKRNDIWYHPEAGNTVPYIYAFTTFFDIIEDRTSQGADIHLKELPETLTNRHTVVSTLTTQTWGGGYERDRIGGYSLAFSPFATYLQDGTLFLSSPSGSAVVNAVIYAYTGRKGTTAYNYAEYSRQHDTTQPGATQTGLVIRPILSSLTPVVAKAAINYLPTTDAVQATGNSGSIITMSAGFASESKIPAFARVKGAWNAETFNLIDVGSVKGYKLNNDRGTLPDIERCPTISFQDKNKGIRHGHTFFTNLDVDDKVMNYEITHDYQVLKTVKFPKAVRTKFETDIVNLFNSGTFLTTYRFCLLPGDVQNRALYVVTVANKDTGASFRAYGVMKVTTSTSGNALTITNIDLLGSRYYKFAQSAWFYYFSVGAIMNCGWACVEQTDGTLDFAIKEGSTTGGINGNQSGVSGCYHFTQPTIGDEVTLKTSLTSIDGSSNVLFPAVGPQNIGLCTIDATAGLGTNYLIKPIVATGNADMDKGFLIGSPTPSKTFTINIGGDIPVQLNGAVGVIPAQSMDLATLGGGVAANKTFYYYAVEKNKEVTMEVLTTPVNETLSRTLFAIVKTNAEIVENIKALPFSRLGTYRLSETPIGSAVAFNRGSFAEYVSKFWLTRWYGDQDIDWNDYFIPETTMVGPTYQVLTLAPDARFEMVLYAPGGGGGSSRRTYEWLYPDPQADGGVGEKAILYFSDTTYCTLTGGLGGTEGAWGNGSSYTNGTGGLGGSYTLSALNHPGLIIEEVSIANGNVGKNSRPDHGGGDPATLNLPSHIPSITESGVGGEGAPGRGDESLSFGGGGGSGAGLYVRFRNESKGPLLVGFEIGSPGRGSIGQNNGSPGHNGVAWYRQIPKP